MSIHPAATLILLRDSAHGPQVFMQRRASSAAFLGGAYVFPGGSLEACDADPRIMERVAGLSDADASVRLGLSSGGLAYWVAAARECYEEAGILLAQDETGTPTAAERVDDMAADRDALNRRELTFAELLTRSRLMLSAGEMIYFDHWITPAIRPRRFDTRFFIARTPPGQEGSHDNAEAVHSAWLRPAEALERATRKEIELAFATRFVLKQLSYFTTVEAVLADTRAKVSIETKRPVVAQGHAGQKIFRRGDAPYAEIWWSDPDETTQTTYDLVPGVPKRLERFVTRLIAPNPGVMTGPGTNTYLVGDEERAVIDPGPMIDAHVDAILACGAERIRWIVCTHTHRDHSPAAKALRAATGARVIGCPPPAGVTQDSDFAPDWIPAHRERLRIAAVTLCALHTPGHASNHVCYLFEETKMLFTGDHVMQGSTVIINPPEGDMRAYLASLDALLELDIAIIAPGHGYLIGDPHHEIRRLVEHRKRREDKVLQALKHAGTATIDELLPTVYADVPLERRRAAARSLLAHLLKLVADGTVRETNGMYGIVSA